MAAKPKAKKGKNGPESTSRVHRGVEVLQRSVKRWSDYASESAQLAARGNLNPGAWAKGYAEMWSGLARDVGDLTKLVFEEKKRAATKSTKK